MPTSSFLRTSKPFVLAAILAAASSVARAQTGPSPSLVVPIVLSSGGVGDSSYSSEVTLTNRGTSAVNLWLQYTAAFGGGDGITVDSLLAGEQRVIPDAIAYLRGKGLPLPATGDRGGTLRVTFLETSSADAAAVTVRTATRTREPQPVGIAGLSYPGASMHRALKGSATVYGLRSNSADRSNLAIYNPTEAEVTVRVTAFSGDGSGDSFVKADSLPVPAFGWTQFNGALAGSGFASGWVTVERTSGAGGVGAYGVVNDNVTSDGSFIPHTEGGIAGSRLTVPVLVETSAFVSELVLANRGGSPATLTLRYVESLTPALGNGGSVALTLQPREQLILPDAIGFLRGKGLAIGPRGAAGYAGALRVDVAGVPLDEVFAGARTASIAPAGGQFGLFTPGVYEGREATTEAFLYGLRADADNRSNVAVLNAGPDGSGSVTLELQAFDGDAGGVAKGVPEVYTLAPGAWRQAGGFLGGRGVRNGWVRVTRLSGSAPWIAYGVVNDGGEAGQRTGDGAYVEMVAAPPTAPWAISVLRDIGLFGPSSPALAFNPQESPTIAYLNELDTGVSHVKASRWDPVAYAWRTDSLYPEGSKESWHRVAAATDPGDGNPSIVFGSDAIELAHWSGTAWQTGTVETVGKVDDRPSLVYGPDGRPSISYVATTPTTGLRFARWSGSAWITESVDPDPAVGPVSSLAYDGQGNPAVAYGVRSPGASRPDTLRLARRSGSGWTTEVVETGVPGFGEYPSLAFDGSGRPAIAHGDGLTGPPGIRFVRWTGEVWSAEVVSPDGEPGGLVFDGAGVPFVAFASWTPGAARIASREPGAAWRTETVEDFLFRVSSPRMTLDPVGKPALVYVREEKAPGGDEVRSIGYARMR